MDFSKFNVDQKEFEEFVTEKNWTKPQYVAEHFNIEFTTALLLCMYHFSIHKCTPWMTIHHASHDENVIMLRELKLGFPELPVYCHKCKKDIVDPSELRFGYQFQY